MKRSDLHPQLQQEYSSKRKWGVARVEFEGFENTWFVVPPPPPRELGKLQLKHSIPLLAHANEIISTLSKLPKVSHFDLLISSLLVRREALQSSRMEGTWSTIDAVLTPTEVWSDADRKSTHASVYGYAHALEKHFDQCSKNGVKSLNLSLVKSLHREIMQKDPDFRGSPGKLRQPNDLSSVVFIGGLLRKEDSIYNPTPPNQVESCLDEVMDWYSDDLLVEMGDAGMGLSLALRMAIGHTHFEAVHPFTDGNGRVGRMIMTLQMACSKSLPLYLSGFIEKEKEDYYRALMQAQKKLKYEPIVEFIAQAIVESYGEFEASKKALIQLPKEWAKRGQFREKSGSKRALEWMVGHPIFTASQLQSYLGVSKPAAHRAIQQLMDANLIQERSGKQKNRIFAAEDVIEVLARPFKEDPKIALARAAAKLRSR